MGGRLAPCLNKNENCFQLILNIFTRFKKNIFILVRFNEQLTGNYVLETKAIDSGRLEVGKTAKKRVVEKSFVNLITHEIDNGIETIMITGFIIKNNLLKNFSFGLC